jgi:hypothetical protein
MNTTQQRNKLHEQGLTQTEAFIKSGGKVTKPPSNYQGQVYEFPRPKHRAINRPSKSE